MTLPPRPMNILITAASRRVAMVKGFVKALADLGVPGAVHVTDTDPLSTGLRFAHKAHMVPFSDSPSYLPRLLEICQQEHIRLVVPTIDEELINFGSWKEEFVRNGAIPLVSDTTVGRICRDKFQTARWFGEHQFPFATTWLPGDIDPAKAKYPLFIKPRKGRGSVGAHMIKNERELRFFVDYVEDPVIQTYLHGSEFTVDVLAGLDGRILSVVPRQRMVIRSGVCDRGQTVMDKELIALCARICETMQVVGPVNLQLKKQRGKATFFEVNPRFSGAIQLTVAAGADFFRMIVEEALGRNPAPAVGAFKGGVLMMSYEDSLFELNGKRLS
ncbi:MAG: ATP-grasp domain-containing protein [Nitrospinae bacterium]|nr:ATP-grasp domain-containing protein [Nitrospinota bacterium]